MQKGALHDHTTITLMIMINTVTKGARHHEVLNMYSSNTLNNPVKQQLLSSSQKRKLKLREIICLVQYGSYVKAELSLELRLLTSVQRSALSLCELEKHVNVVKGSIFTENSTVFISKESHSPQSFALNRGFFIILLLNFSLSLISTFKI